MNILSSGGRLHFLKNLYLRWKYGAGCCDVFNLDYYLAKLIIRPLKRFRDGNKCGHPMDFKTMEEWHKCLDEMIWAFQYIIDGEPTSYYKNGNIDWRPFKREQRGLSLFGKHFRSLWI